MAPALEPSDAPAGSGERPLAPTPPAAAETGPRLRMATMRLARLLRQNADPGLGLTQTLWSALGTVERSGPVTLGRLAEMERVQPPSMTRIVAQLEERGLVVREVDGNDRRVVRVRSSEAGHRLVMDLRIRRDEFLAARLSELSPTELATLDTALPLLERIAGIQR